MNEHRLEHVVTRLDNPEFYLELQNAVADRLDDLATDPKFKNAGFPLDLGERIRKGQAVSASIMIRDAIIGVGQDFRLDNSEMDIVKKRFLEE